MSEIAVNEYLSGTVEWVDEVGHIICRMFEGMVGFSNGYTAETLPEEVKRDIIERKLKV
jgi:hypothetical protein